MIAHAIKGHIDLISRDMIAGWLHWPAAPAPTLEVLDGTDIIGHCRADQPRADLTEAGFGDPPCAFSFLVPLEHSLGELPSLGKGLRLRLAGTPLYLLPDSTTRYST